MLGSQSFIHQVRILSCKRVLKPTGTIWGRNPLFIKSEFSLPRSGSETSVKGGRRNPLFIKSEFSQDGLQGIYRGSNSKSRNPLFIKSEFSLCLLFCANSSDRTSRNPLFIKSEFSLNSSQYESTSSPSRNPLFIKSEFSPRLQRRFLYRPCIQVAILYSSSQNSLSTSAIPCPAWAKI